MHEAGASAHLKSDRRTRLFTHIENTGGRVRFCCPRGCLCGGDPMFPEKSVLSHTVLHQLACAHKRFCLYTHKRGPRPLMMRFVIARHPEGGRVVVPDAMGRAKGLGVYISPNEEVMTKCFGGMEKNRKKKRTKIMRVDYLLRVRQNNYLRARGSRRLLVNKAPNFQHAPLRVDPNLVSFAHRQLQDEYRHLFGRAAARGAVEVSMVPPSASSPFSASGIHADRCDRASTMFLTADDATKCMGELCAFTSDTVDGPVKIIIHDDFENALELVALNLRLNFLSLVSTEDFPDVFPSFLLHCFDEAGIKGPEYMQRSRQRRRKKHDTPHDNSK